MKSKALLIVLFTILPFFAVGCGKDNALVQSESGEFDLEQRGAVSVANRSDFIGDVLNRLLAASANKFNRVDLGVATNESGGMLGVARRYELKGGRFVLTMIDGYGLSWSAEQLFRAGSGSFYQGNQQVYLSNYIGTNGTLYLKVFELAGKRFGITRCVANASSAYCY